MRPRRAVYDAGDHDGPGGDAPPNLQGPAARVEQTLASCSFFLPWSRGHALLGSVQFCPVGASSEGQPLPWSPHRTCTGFAPSARGTGRCYSPVNLLHFYLFLEALKPAHLAKQKWYLRHRQEDGERRPGAGESFSWGGQTRSRNVRQVVAKQPVTQLLNDF